jgi:hypothetical protein
MKHPVEEVLLKVTGCPTHTGFGLAVKPAVGAGSAFTVNEATWLQVSLNTVTLYVVVLVGETVMT